METMHERRRREDHIADESAQLAVKQVFGMLGVDVDDPASVEEFRADLRFGRSLRRVANHGVLALVGVIAVAMAAAMWAGIVERVHG